MNPRMAHVSSLLLAFMATLRADAQELNTVMMHATCKIVGSGSMGTGFVIVKPETNTSARGFYVLVTADHVLSAITADTATLVMRQSGPSNSWNRIEFPVKIRSGGKPLWHKHPDVDAAAMFVGVPTNTMIRPVTTSLLVDDKILSEYEFHPGMELLCLGYPFGAESNADGFPILRSGRIASYPLTPTKTTRTFLFDFTVFPGNSGGPVYFVVENPSYGGSTHLGITINGIIGIVVEERRIRETTQDSYEKREKTTPLRLGEVVHAAFLKELVESLGFPP